MHHSHKTNSDFLMTRNLFGFYKRTPIKDHLCSTLKDNRFLAHHPLNNSFNGWCKLPNSSIMPILIFNKVH